MADETAGVIETVISCRVNTRGIKNNRLKTARKIKKKDYNCEESIRSKNDTVILEGVGEGGGVEVRRKSNQNRTRLAHS